MSVRPPPHLSEHFEQVIVVKALFNAGLCFTAVPNGGKRNPITGAILKAEGVKKGFPDLLIFDSPPLFPWVKGVAIEMKTLIGTTKPEQRAWADELIKRGWLVESCKGATRALNYLASLGYRVPSDHSAGMSPAQLPPKVTQ